VGKSRGIEQEVGRGQATLTVPLASFFLSLYQFQIRKNRTLVHTTSRTIIPLKSWPSQPARTNAIRSNYSWFSEL